MYVNTDMRIEGAAQGLGPVAKQMPPVARAMEQLEKELHHLRESVRMLSSRLGPVLVPCPDSPIKEGTLRGSASPLAMHIDAMTDLARLTGADVRSLIDQLEL